MYELNFRLVLGRMWHRLSNVLIAAAALGVASTAAFGQCTFTVSPSPAFVDSTAQTATFQVTASAANCAWTATSSGFATVNGAGTGTGNGSVGYTVAANGSGAARNVNLTIAGNTVVLNQDATPTTFSDVFPPDYYFDGANILRQDNITAGCATTPTLQYCPNQNVTRGQMAIFVVRTVLGGGAAVDNFSYSATPYFTDVPSTHIYFKWIQKLRDLGVTAGCSATQYCPNDNITRGQMAVFIIRLRLGASTTFTYNPTPFFTDVAANYAYFTWIQKLKEIGITGGCTITTYCPNDFVTRGQMAIFLVRAGFNGLLTPSAPLLTSASPNSGAPGKTVTVALTGINTNFVKGTTTVAAPPGITVGTVTVTDATHLSVALTIPAGTPLGPVSLTAATASEQATLPNGFLIGFGDPVPTITDFNPKSGPIGTAVTLTGTGLVSSAGTPADVRMALQGGGVVSAPLTAATATSLSFVVPSTAATGTITVAGSSGSATSTSPFTITPSNTFTITAAPTSLNLIAGQTSTYTIALASTNGFTGLATLSLTGLPAGLTASFNPQQITAGQQSTLSLTAPASQQASTAQLVITAAGTVDGLPLSLSANATLNLTPITTSFVGRTTVDDTNHTSLAGVAIAMMGQDGAGNKTGCTGSTTSDASGNFALTGLAASCVGPQMVSFNGNTVTAPPGKYAGVNLVFTLVSGQVVASPVLVHLPRIDNVETFSVTQNSTKDQSYTFKSIPGLSVTVYAGTVFTQSDGTQPNPFPLAAIEVPVDRLPDLMPLSNTMVTAFIVAFQPANTTASAAVAVYFPNTLNTPPGTSMPLMTLDPTRGRMVPYGTGTVSNDGTTIIPDVDPATGSLNHRYGIVHFDWHGAAVTPPPTTNPPPDPCAPSTGKPVDLASGVEVLTSTDLVLNGNRGSVAITRTYRSLSNQQGPFGIGAFHNYEYRLDTLTPQSAAMINLALPNGTRVPFTRQSDGTLINTTTPMMQGAVMSTLANGTTTLRWPTGAYYQFVPGNFLSNTVLTAIGDPNGNVTAIVRVPANPLQISEIDDPVGRKLTFAYDSTNRITSITDPIGRVVSYTYNSTGTLATYTNVLGGVTQYQYDSQNRLTKVTDPRGVVLAQNTYDANGRVTQQVTASGGSYLYAYTLTNSLVPTSPVVQTQVTDPRGNVTTYRFNTQGFVISATDPTGQTRTFDRDPRTNLVLGIHGAGTCQVCGATSAGDVTFSYDVNGNLLTRTNALGNTTSYAYEPVFNRVTSITDRAGNLTKLAYDTRGNLLSITDARNNTTTFTYDFTGLVIQAQDATGQKTSFAYDAQGNLIKVTNALNQATALGYDAVSRLVAQNDPAGGKLTLAYNAMGELIALVDGNGAKTNISRDPSGFITSYSDPRGGAVTFGYDAAGRISSRKDQLGNTSSYTYDLMNNLISSTNRKGQLAKFSFDALNRKVSEQYFDGTTVLRTYDSFGHLVLVVDSVAGSFSMSYGPTGRLVKSVGPFGVVNYTRDKNDRVLSRQVQGDPEVDYSYDAAGNLAKAVMSGASVSQAFDAKNLPQTITRSNGVVGTLTRDALGRLVSLSEANGGTNLVSRSYSYDALGRVTSQASEAGLSLSTPAATGTFNGANQITAGGPGGGTTYTQDADGNLLTETSVGGVTSYTWDARGRLQAILAPGGITTSFVYDYNGNLIQKRVVSGGTDMLTRYVLDDMTNVASQQNVGVGSVALLTGRSLDDHWAVLAGTSPVFALVDNLYSTVALTDSTGSVVGRAYYEPYGATSESGSSFPFEFTGRSRVKSDLYYFRARYYSTTSQRFISEDPGGEAPNLYQYAAGAPTVFTDPLGYAPGDKWWGYNNRDFQDWYHRNWKQPGDPDATREDIEEAYREWENQGKPKRDQKGDRRKPQCEDPQPEPQPEPQPQPDDNSSKFSDWVDDHKNTLITIGIGVGVVVVVGGIIVLTGGAAAPVFALGAL